MARRLTDYQLFSAAALRAMGPRSLAEGRRAMRQVGRLWRGRSNPSPAREQLAFMQGRRAFNIGRSPDSNPYVIGSRMSEAWLAGFREAAASPRRNPPADTPALRYQRAVGHGERPSTARTAARNPGRAVGRMAPNCPNCGALVRLPNPLPPTVECRACGTASLVRRP